MSKPTFLRILGYAAAAGAVFGLAAFGVFQLASRAAPKAAHSDEVAVEDAEVTASTRAPSSKVEVPAHDVRAELRRARAEATKVSLSNLDGYLRQLEGRAVRNGRVSALEVEPGVDAIDANGGDPEKLAAFTQRMMALQREFERGGATGSQAPAGSVADLSIVLADINRSSGEQKQGLIRAYVDGLSALPPEEQSQAVAKLNEAVGRRDGPADAEVLDALWQGIEESGNPDARQGLIDEYLELIDVLPEDEKARRVQVLNQRYGPADER